MKNCSRKILSVLLAVLMLFSVVMLSAYADKDESVVINVEQVSKDGDTLTVAINFVEGMFNSIDLSFKMNGLTCVSIREGDCSSGSDILFASNPAGNAMNNIAMVAVDGIYPGNIAVVTLRFVEEKYNFDVVVSACSVATDTGNKETVVTVNNTVSGMNHSYTSVVTAPTCDDDGYTTYTCNCGDSYVADYVGALGHDMGEWNETTAPTCTKKGKEVRGCSRCDKTESRDVPVIDHKYDSVVTAPTCEDEGYTTYTCNCGDSYVADYVDSLGHNPGEWVIKIPATPKMNGLKTRSCSVCSEVVESQSIPKLGSVYSVSISGVSMNYKNSATLTPEIIADEGINYTVTYSSSDSSVATVDENGNVYASGTGSATITCTVADEYGNTVTDTCDVEVEYTWWQWIIVIVLFGWIWY